jgi:hypothetical protein
VGDGAVGKDGRLEFGNAWLYLVDRVLEEDGCLGCAKASGRMDDSVVDGVLSASELRDPLMPRGQFSRFVTRESFFQVKDLRAHRF